jgi:LDH2 family malate/lactate/ureidoglycolate dehydrogenase
MLGTNPIAIAFPGQDERPVVIDFATSVVPWGKVEEYVEYWYLCIWLIMVVY